MRPELDGLSELIDEVARIDEALATNYSRSAGRLEHRGFGGLAASIRDVGRRHSERASRARRRCSAFIDEHG